MNTEARQKHIIEQAIKIIHENGYSSLSIRKLARKEKISEAAIYRHFLNKEDILLGILTLFSGFDKQLNQEIAMIHDPLEKLSHFMLFHFTYLEKHVEMTSVIFSEDIFKQSEILKKKMQTIIQNRKKALFDIVNAMNPENCKLEIDVEEFVVIVLGYIRLIVLEWRLSNYAFSLKARGNKAIKFVKTILQNKSKCLNERL
ncbi:MAG: TetR/AcrR family transcriptional regulator [Candidatus Aminicenantes bacterium]|nr:TetR/AcrR family transcriptional regulator [Candidatus Aminicenantes bacterium]